MAPNPYELPARAAIALLDAAKTAIEESGHPGVRHAYLGTSFPLCSHSFLTVSESATPLPAFEDLDPGGSDHVAYVPENEFLVTIGRIRPIPVVGGVFDAGIFAEPPRCSAPLPVPKDDTSCSAYDEADPVCSPYGTLSEALLASSVDRAVLEGSLRSYWCEAIAECRLGYGIGRTTRFVSTEPFEEGRFIGSRLRFAAKLR